MNNTNKALEFFSLLQQRDIATPRLIPRVMFSPQVCRTTDMHQVQTACGDVMIFHSEGAMLQSQAGVFWHDDADHCRTWTDAGCCCDSEAVDCAPPKVDPLPQVVVMEIRLGPNGVQSATPRAPTAAELEQLQRTPVTPDGPPVVLKAGLLNLELVPAAARPPLDFNPNCQCAACTSRAAAVIFGGPGSPNKGQA